MEINELSRSLTELFAHLQFRLDTTRYFFDAPSFDYQPLPWVGIKSAGVRGKATIARWKTIRKYLLTSDKSLKDIGSCVGYFCIAAAAEYNLLTLGVDMNERFLRISRYATPKKLVGRCNFINLKIDEKSAGLLPKTDVTLCLSIWHHWVFSYGLTSATRILKQIWSLTDRALFFESGEEEVRDEFKLPYPNGQTASAWIANYLIKNLDNSKVEIIGKFESGDYPHYRIKRHKRTLFKITKTK